MGGTAVLKRALRLLTSRAFAWLAVGALGLAGLAGLYAERHAVQHYMSTTVTAWPRIVVLSSDDWGGLPPRETVADVSALADTLRQCRDSLGRSAVLTVYMIPFEPDPRVMARDAGVPPAQRSMGVSPMSPTGVSPVARLAGNSRCGTADAHTAGHRLSGGTLHGRDAHATHGRDARATPDAGNRMPAGREGETPTPRYICRRAYDDASELPALWKSLADEGLVEIGFHGRDHWNGPLYVELLRTQPAFRQAAERGQIPYRNDAAYDNLFARDARLRFLQRSFVNAAADPPHALPLDEQRRLVREGLDAIHAQTGVRPVVAVAPGHVWDTLTARALQAEGVAYLETVPLAISTPDTDGRLTATGERAGYGSRAGIDLVIRTDGYEPAWQKAPTRLSDRLWSLRKSLVCNVPAVISLHKASFVGDDEPAKARARDDLRQLLDMVKTEFPDVVFLSAADLGHYMHNRPDQARRRVEFTRADLAFTDRIGVTVRAMWRCHAKWRVYGVVLAASMVWACMTAIAASRRPSGITRMKGLQDYCTGTSKQNP